MLFSPATLIKLRSRVTVRFSCKKLRRGTRPRLTAGIERTPQRAMLRAIGLTDEDLDKPIIGIANTWVEAQPCNYNLRELAQKVKKGVRDAGGTPLEFNTIAVNDAMAMGHEGMKASLISREVIADSIELGAVGYQFDALVTIGGCDKTQPACVMAMARTQPPEHLPLRGEHPAGRVEREGGDDSGRLRGDGAGLQGDDDRRSSSRPGVQRLPDLRGVRRDVHREHDVLGHRGARA